MTHPFTRTLLAVSGSMGLAIGTGILFLPHAFHATSGIALGTDPSLLSEMRAPGGLLILASLLALAGAVKRSLARTGLILSASVYGSYGLSRLISLAVDGTPSDSLLLAALIELVVAALSLFALTRFQFPEGDLT